MSALPLLVDVTWLADNRERPDQKGHIPGGVLADLLTGFAGDLPIATGRQFGWRTR